MAATYLTDLAFIPETFRDYAFGVVRQSSNFFQSGAMVETDVLVPTYGKTVTLPHWDGLRGDSAIKSASAPAVNDVDGLEEIAPIMDRVRKWGMNDLAISFTNSDPLGALGDQVGQYWAREVDALAIAAVRGAAAGIDALSTGSVINNISGGSGAAAVISANAIIDTQALADEYLAEFNLMVVHPAIYAALRKQNLVVQVPNSEGTALFDFYGSARVIQSNRLTASAGVYDTLILRTGAVGYADGTNPAWVLEADRSIGHESYFASSKRWAVAPRGAKFTGTPAGATASAAELTTAGNWTLGSASVMDFGARILRARAATA